MICIDPFKQRERYSHVRESEHGMLLLDYMTANFPRFDREQWAGKIAEKRFLINGVLILENVKLKKHDRVSLIEDLQDEPNANLLFKTVYEDEHLLVFDKPSDLCVHPSGLFYKHTLWFQAGLKYGELFFIGRLDRETSGLVIAARTKEVAACMQTENRIFHKEYHVLVHGKFEKYIRAKGYLFKDATSSIAKKRRFSVDFVENGEFTDTEFFPVEYYPNGLSLVRAVLHTGRMHQIRASIFSLGYPVVGDKLYGLDENLYKKTATQSFSTGDMAKLLLKNQALHCSQLEFKHPLTGDVKILKSAVPQRFYEFNFS